MPTVNALLAGLYILGLYGAFMAGAIYLRTQALDSTSPPKTLPIRLPQVTLFLLFVVGIPSILQFFYPVLVALLQRDAVRFMHGECWRLITPLFVQDGGIAGASFNLASLVLV